MEPQEVSVLLRDGTGAEAVGHLLGAERGLEGGRVCAVLEHGRAPVFALGSYVELELRGQQGDSAGVHAQVLQHRSGNQADWYVLDVDEADAARLSGVVNRRTHVRVRPTVAAPVVALLSAPDGSSSRRVTVKDLSESGAGLLVRPPEDLELLAQPRLRLELVLRGEERPLDLRARLAFRRLAGSMLHYGLAFDAVASPGFEATRARLAAWIAERQSGAEPTRIAS
jgi:hypothetical protein